MLQTTQESGIARIDINGENENVVVSENVQDFEVQNGQVYYVNKLNQICKVSENQNKVLSESISARKIQVIDNWIYYYNEAENALFRLKNDGTKNELISVLINNETYNISGKYVYYFDKQNSKIARMKIGESNKCDDIVKISTAKTKINIVGDELYYLDKSADNSQTYQIHRIKVNGDKINDVEY